MKVLLKKADYDKMVAHAKVHLPEEACGLIAGHDEDGVRVIEKVYLIENVDHTNEHFTITPKAQLEAIKNMRQNGLKPLGNWHSHPESPSRSSQEDIRLAYDSSASYLILSLMNEEPVLHSFHVENGQSTKEDLNII
ncbi:MAG: M67 family metallopeptidase [Intestinibaculum porci]|uniref:M67 family metallopeptidase n=1 Tax=Intestinibaculum porci TaxID=2487118 RepID=UPI003F0721A9